MPIFRAKYIATKTDGRYKKGQVIGYKIFDAKSLADAENKKRWEGSNSSRSIVGPGRKVIAVTPTRLKGTVKSRYSLPRSRRYGRGYY